MKKTTAPTHGIFALILALLLWCASFAVQESSFFLTFWVHGNVLHLGNSVETEAAFGVALFYAVLSLVAVICLATSFARFISKAPFTVCLRWLVVRYPLFWSFLPLVVTVISWSMLFPFLPAKAAPFQAALPIWDALLDVAGVLSDLVFFLTAVTTILSVAAFFYGILTRSNAIINHICTTLWVVYGSYVSYALPTYWEYGKWFFTLCLIWNLPIIVLWFRRNKTPVNLSPCYDLQIIALDSRQENGGTATMPGGNNNSPKIY